MKIWSKYLLLLVRYLGKYKWRGFFFRPAMGNLRPFELFSVALLKSLKHTFFIGKSVKSVEKEIPILALDMTVQHEFGPRADLGCPWLF